MTVRVGDFMSTDVETLSVDDTLEDAVHLEMRRKIRHIPIVRDGQLVGIVTDRDLKRAMPSLLTGTDRQSHERVMKQTRVEQIMTRSPATIAPGAPLRDAVEVFCTRKFNALPVVDGSKLVGIITVIDVMRAFRKVLDGEPLA